DSYAGNTKAGPVARIDTVDFVRVVDSRLKTRRDARPGRYGAAEAALLKIGFRVSASGLDHSRRAHTAVPSTDTGSISISFNERVGRTRTRLCGTAVDYFTTIVACAENSRNQRYEEECCY